MPRNAYGGNKARAGKNGEGAKAKKNRLMVDNVIDDIVNGEINLADSKSDICVGKVFAAKGNARFEIVTHGHGTVNAPVMGSLKGKGKVRIYTGNVVVLARNGYGGSAEMQIIAALSDKQISRLRKLNSGVDDKLLSGATGAEGSSGEEAFEFDYENGPAEGEEEGEGAEVDIDNI